MGELSKVETLGDIAVKLSRLSVFWRALRSNLIYILFRKIFICGEELSGIWMKNFKKDLLVSTTNEIIF